jgi:hypothetical protein
LGIPKWPVPGGQEAVYLSGARIHAASVAVEWVDCGIDPIPMYQRMLQSLQSEAVSPSTSSGDETKVALPAETAWEAPQNWTPAPSLLASPSRAASTEDFPDNGLAPYFCVESFETLLSLGLRVPIEPRIEEWEYYQEPTYRLVLLLSWNPDYEFRHEDLESCKKECEFDEWKWPRVLGVLYPGFEPSLPGKCLRERLQRVSGFAIVEDRQRN